MDKLIRDRYILSNARYETIRGHRFEAAALVQVFRPGGSAGFPSFSNSSSRAWWFPGRSEVAGPSSALFLLAPNPTKRPRPFAYERPPNTAESLSPLFLFPLSLSFPPRWKCYLFVHAFHLNEIFGPGAICQRRKLKSFQAFVLHQARFRCELG